MGPREKHSLFYPCESLWSGLLFIFSVLCSHKIITASALLKRFDIDVINTTETGTLRIDLFTDTAAILN